MPAKLSIIVVNFNTRALLGDCLASLRGQDNVEAEVLVIDNHSSDGSPDLVRREYHEVRLIENPENLGFSKANNIGLRAAAGGYILLLNSDTVVRPNALRAMVEFMDAHPEAGAVTCRLLNADGTLQACVSRRPGPHMLFLRLFGFSRLVSGERARHFLARCLGSLLGSTIRSYLAPYQADQLPVEVENISGACLMLRRQAVEQVGLLDERFFMYFEDMDYCIRLRKAGWKLFYVPTGEIVHLVGRSSGGRMRDYSLHSYQSLFYFYKKHYPGYDLFLVRAIVFIASCARWLHFRIKIWFSELPAYRQHLQDLEKVIRFTVSYSPGS